MGNILGLMGEVILVNGKKIKCMVEVSLIGKEKSIFKFFFILNRRYVGDFYENTRHGYGEMHWRNGTIYKGYWEDGRREGRAIVTRNDKKKTKLYLEYNQGKLI
jgi:hypothetical protein